MFVSGGKSLVIFFFFLLRITNKIKVLLLLLLGNAIFGVNIRTIKITITTTTISHYNNIFSTYIQLSESGIHVAGLARNVPD